MGFLDDLFSQPFGGLFDFDGDGETDIGEEWVGRMMMKECMKEEEEEEEDSYTPYFGSSFVPRSVSGNDNDDDDMDDKDEYEEDEEDNDTWRLYANEGDEYGIDPFDYDTEEAYLEAVDEAIAEWQDLAAAETDSDISPFDYDSKEEYEQALADAESDDITSSYDEDEAASDTAEDASISLPIHLSFSVEYPGKEELEAIKPADYPNKRTFEAAYHLCKLKNGTAYVSSGSAKEREIKKCEFILSQACVAARYLTIYNGFLYAQAVKEHYTLPVEVPDEDEGVKTRFYDLLIEVAEEDANLAVDIWVWVVKEFSPYKEYMESEQSIYNIIVSFIKDFPPEFLLGAIKKLGNDPIFANAVLTANSDWPSGAAHFVAVALTNEMYSEAQEIFSATIRNTTAKSTDLENLISNIISDCSNWKELETMEAFQQYILPLIKNMTNKRVQRLLPSFIEKVDDYISTVERREETYQWSRRFAWRKNCTEGKEYGVDPLRFQTEEEYNEALQRKKYGWRRWKAREAERYHLNLEDYETEEAYQAALAQERQKASSPQNDPLLTSDNSIYTFCGVQFPSANRAYHYLTGKHPVKLGDHVIVPVGSNEEKMIAEVVSLVQCKRTGAPYSVEKAKTILGIYHPDTSADKG